MRVKYLYIQLVIAVNLCAFLLQLFKFFLLPVELNAESVGAVRFIKNRLVLSKFYDFNFN